MILRIPISSRLSFSLSTYYVTAIVLVSTFQYVEMSRIKRVTGQVTYRRKMVSHWYLVSIVHLTGNNFF